ncbi:MAG: cyclopropane-fatty-acyl-phospholipid synthase family protein [Acidimicrobiales bacterium]|nr:cyclopropane-fatty-acyl-phospholipid synthase family protein [Acidimicrobiales bacterium]
MALSSPSLNEPDPVRLPPGAASDGTVVAALRPVLKALTGDEPPVRIELWDGSAIGPSTAPGTIRVRSAAALRRIVWAPGGLGLARAHVAGELDVDGDLVGLLDALKGHSRPDQRVGLRGWLAALVAAARVHALGPPPAPPQEEVRPRGLLHSKARDARAVSHHYDVGNEFYDIVLGQAMTYSCAYFDDPGRTLAEAQAAKHELVSRKLGLHERSGARLLDVGCGWGSMAIHAALHHGASVVGVTISAEQAHRARERVEAAGLGDQVEVRLQDYRDVRGETFDAISSIGMFEHVGQRRTAEYFGRLSELLRPTGRLLNDAISSVTGSRLRRRSFTGRYVFPDGELLDVGEVVLAMESAGLEVRDLESLREHYARTLRAWSGNLEAGWEEAVRLVGEARARVWRLYMAGSAVGFDDGGISIHQVLGVRPAADGRSGMPSTRESWLAGTLRP